MRVSIPALFILFVLVIKYLFDSKKFHIGKVILTLALMLGMVTPFFEFYRGCYIAFINKAEPLFKDKVVTLNNRIKPICRMKVITYDAFIMSLGNYRNYGAVNLNKHIFFKYLAKKNKNKDYNRHN